MKTSERLYGNLDYKTAKLQLLLFARKRKKAFALIDELKPTFNVGSFTDVQRELEFRVDDIKKAIQFCNGQIEEALEVLNDKD